MYSLPMALRLNAASCLGFGLLFAIAPGASADFLGAMPPALVRAIGLLLALNGLHLAWASLRRVPRAELMYFVFGDLAWVSLTALVLGIGGWITTAAGVAAAVAVAVCVGAFGVLQAAALGLEAREGDALPARYGMLGAIGASWASMKAWVKVWLVLINATFLTALIFWPDPVARLALAGYVAAGPWLLAIMAAQRGLTRLLGIAHLIPWTPLAVYLALRLTGDMAGPRLALDTPLGLYALALLLVSGACMAFDWWDLVRWVRGERYRLGAPNAAAAGASRAA